jgi:HK97 family phage prohead protease
MPYFITDASPECEAWATVKEDGELLACHADKDAAIAQMVAISLQEGIEPGGERKIYKKKVNYRAEPDELSVGDFVRWSSGTGVAQGRITRIVREGEINVPDSSFTITGEPDNPAALIRIFQERADGWEATDTLVGHRFSTLTKIEDLRSDTRELPENYRPALAENVPEGRACGNCIFFNEDRQNEEGTKAWCERWQDFVDGGYYCNAWQPDVEPEERQVNLAAPAFMRAAARQGLRYHEEGLSGDGLVDRTVREARAMAAGNVTADKWVRIRAWIARHLVDLDSPAANPNNEDYPSAGVVAHLLWGSGPSKRAAQRTLAYADRIVTRLEEDNRAYVSVEGENMAKIEQRTNTVKLELREDGDGMTFEGYAAIFDSPSEPLPFIERIKRGAFNRSLTKARNDIKLLWNHETSSVLGSTRAGTLKLYEDERGLKVTATLPDTMLGRDAATLLKRGDVDSMSFGFSVPAGGDSWNEDGSERILKSVRLHEVSIVAFPAYTSTAGTTSVRGLDKVAERASVSPDDLADALLLLEEGKDLSPEAADLLRAIIQELSPTAIVMPEIEEDMGDMGMLELKKTKLKLMEI